jgi:single-stranded-DNA-specific exonuclease
MLYRWFFKQAYESDKLREIQKQFDVNPVIAQLILDRNLPSTQAIHQFLKPDLQNLHDPYKICDMDKAVKRITKALRDGENILIYGDYDVDGITGVSIMYDGIFKLGGKVSFYIPNRITEGYGLSSFGILAAQKKKIDLIITVDCGITAIEEVNLANEKGIDVIICDHHEPADSLPDAKAILNPKVKECDYPFKELAGVGVAFKMLQALYASLDYSMDDLKEYLDLVAIGTAADIVPLLDENRILVKYGLEKINNNPRNGLFALLESTSLLGRELGVSLIVFVLAPRLNAVGRMSTAKKAVHLLTSSSLQQSRNIARILESENKTRRNIDELTCQEAIELVERTIDLEKSKILVLAKHDWHLGVIGIVASRIMEKFNRPSVLISVIDGIGKGSARSTPNFDIYEALGSVGNLLENYGGHKYAAGLTIREENIAELKNRLEDFSGDMLTAEDLTPTLEIQCELSLKDLDAKFLKWLKQFAPYGPKNMRPVYVTRNMEVLGEPETVGQNHLRFKVRNEGIVIDAIAFNFADIKMKLDKPMRRIDAAYVIEENTWNGQTTIQMRVKDFNVV